MGNTLQCDCESEYYSGFVDRNIYERAGCISNRFYGSDILLYNNIIKAQTVCVITKIIEESAEFAW